jgi:hypothetical protein
MSEVVIVRAALTAETLISDYLRAAQEMTRLMSANDEEGFRVHLAEANRLYPAIWDQLEHARTAAHASGRTTPAYDALRGGRDQNATGLEYDATEWQVDVLRSLATTGLAMRKRISVELNLRGIALAKQSVAALRADAPDLDWVGEKRSLDALGDINVTSRNTGTAIKVIFFLIVGGIVLWIYVTLQSH